VRTRAELVRILRACAIDDGDSVAALARRVPLDGLTPLAVEHGVAGSVHRQIGRLDGLESTELRELAAVALSNRVNHVRIGRDLQYLAGVLAPLRAPWLVVKGPAVAATLYTPPEQRAAGDIDVLIGPDDFEAAVVALEHAGHPVDDANWPLVRRMTAGQLHFVLPLGTVLDLHWHLLYRADERRRFPLTTGEVLARRRTIAIGGTEVDTLDRVDTLVHLCFHAANEGADRLGWISDIARAAAKIELSEWDDVVARTIAWEMQLPVGTVLQRAARQLGAPVPSWVRARLAPRPWRATMSVADRLFPVAATARNVGNPASLLARSSVQANTPMGAAAAALSGVRRRALHLAHTGAVARVDLTNREDSPASLLYRAEFQAEDRDTYFAAILAEVETDAAPIH
jgi:hypothetical protein